MISRWQKYPFLRLLLPLCIGILLAQINLPVQPIWYVTVIALAFMLYGTVRAFDFRTRGLFGIALNVFFIAGGYLLCVYRNELNQAQHFSFNTTPDNKTYFLAQVTDDESNIYTHRYVVRVYQTHDTVSGTNDRTGNILIYIKNDSSAQTILNIGDWIVMHATPQRITSTGNPDALRRCVHHNPITDV